MKQNSPHKTIDPLEDLYISGIEDILHLDKSIQLTIARWNKMVSDNLHDIIVTLGIGEQEAINRISRVSYSMEPNYVYYLLDGDMSHPIMKTRVTFQDNIVRFVIERIV